MGFRGLITAGGSPQVFPSSLWRAGIIALLVALSVQARIAHGDAYQAAWSRALDHEAGGRLTEAAAELETLLDMYPQDYALALHLGWVRFQAEDYVGAERAYRHAAALSADAVDARVGVIWSLRYQGRHTAAQAVLDQLAAAHPDHAQVVAAQAAGEPSTADDGSDRWIAWTAVGVQDYGDHPTVSAGRGFALGLGGLVGDHLLLGATYRFANYNWDPGDTALVDAVEWNKHEVYTSAGAVFGDSGFSAHYGYLTSDLDGAGDTHVVGLSGWSGVLRVDSAVGFFDDDTVYLLAPSLSLPLVGPLSFEPGTTLQLVEDALLYSGELGLRLAGDAGNLGVSGWMGAQERRVDFTIPAVYDVGGRMHAGGAIDARLAWDDFSIFAGYELADVDSDDSDDSDVAHWFGLGVAIELP